jgi:hypothetical protein
MIFENQFGRWERLLHEFAFRTGFSQLMMADMEDTFFSADLAGIELDRPVFITGLPRSGTTILLRILCDTVHFASHTYQDMPFILCPLIWSRFSTRFVVDRDPRERAHGDGIAISSRSPEGFEEVVWKRFWPEHYSDDRIRPWTESDSNEEFERFLVNHMKKILLLRQTDGSAHPRYLSKNNVNVARLGSSITPLTVGTFVVPFRHPFQQAGSMLDQHVRFSELQERDGFARRYMEAIGHHDFGLGLRPMDFNEWIGPACNPKELDFWIRYWIATYRHVAANLRPSDCLVSYEGLVSEPVRTLGAIAGKLDVPVRDVTAFADEIRSPREHEVEVKGVASEIREEALWLYDVLMTRTEHSLS